MKEKLTILQHIGSDGKSHLRGFSEDGGGAHGGEKEIRKVRGESRRGEREGPPRKIAPKFSLSLPF